MGTEENSTYKFGGGSYNHVFQVFQVYQQDENTTASFRKWRPIKNSKNDSYYAELAVAYIYRLVESDHPDYQSRIKSTLTDDQMPVFDYGGYDPFTENQVELRTLYTPTGDLEPEQAITPKAGWME
tara:strand:- start:1485 stop:1862 length:378 start_codon:yes stop_codon:yes gene_type:complete